MPKAVLAESAKIHISGHAPVAEGDDCSMSSLQLLQVVKLLLGTGHADLAQRSSAMGLTPLHMAARWGHAAVLELLLGASGCALAWLGSSHSGAFTQRSLRSIPAKALRANCHHGPCARECSDASAGPALRRQALQTDAWLASYADGCRTTELDTSDLHDARLALLKSRTAAGRTALEEAEHWGRTACVALLKEHTKSLMRCT
jgi:ankyrin repeat protein